MSVDVKKTVPSWNYKTASKDIRGQTGVFGGLARFEAEAGSGVGRMALVAGNGAPFELLHRVVADNIG